MSSDQSKFVFVCPMYNASKTLGQMLHSVTGQSYENWRLILIDDVSSTQEKHDEYLIIEKYRGLIGIVYDQRIETVWNTEKKWEMANVLHGISMCDDNDIICRIDGDDRLIDLDALTILDSVYQQTNCDAAWSMHRWGLSDRNISCNLSQDADVYQVPWCTSHLKTFRKYLINGIPHENFTNMNGDLVRRCGDQALYLPVLYKSQKRTFIPRVLYGYSIDDKDGTIYQTDDAKFQKQVADFIRSRGFVNTGTSWEKFFLV